MELYICVAIYINMIMKYQLGFYAEIYMTFYILRAFFSKTREFTGLSTLIYTVSEFLSVIIGRWHDESADGESIWIWMTLVSIFLVFNNLFLDEFYFYLFLLNIAICETPGNLQNLSSESTKNEKNFHCSFNRILIEFK